MRGRAVGAPRWLVAVLVVVGLAVAAWLIVTGGDEGATPATSSPPAAAGAGTTSPTRVTGTLDLSDTSQAAVATLGGIVFPTSTADFLTAQVDEGTQLDVTFTLEQGDEASFIAGSGLPLPAVGTRVITHSSPLWKLNPEGSIRGAADTEGAVARKVELVEENGRTRVRAVLTPAA